MLSIFSYVCLARLTAWLLLDLCQSLSGQLLAVIENRFAQDCLPHPGLGEGLGWLGARTVQV